VVQAVVGLCSFTALVTQGIKYWKPCNLFLVFVVISSLPIMVTFLGLSKYQ
jgi:hypothetical protein